MEILNQEAQCLWELEVKSDSMITASMHLFSAHFVSGPVLSPLAYLTLIQAHSNPTRWVPLSPYFTDKEAGAQRG